MPPSPAMRISPGRELKADNHKRGRSLESGVLFQVRDDDLALFNEVQNKERESFLLQSNDDLDDVFSTKLRYFSDYKIGISIPARGESSDLLNAEGDKNDYDWLITPPETPLFRSLDDEAPPVSLAPRGRPRSQPVSISRSSTMEKGYRTAKGSPSPHRLSPSPRSSSSTLQSRSRPFSATHSSPPPTMRHSSPSRRVSPPPSKPSPAPRSSTPTTPRRMSTGSPGPSAPSRARGTSPVKTSRGNSASPKIRAWQSNIPGFSSEAPPNLRTSLADRPATYVRGSSPASRNGSRSGRQSMSPTASRSVSSSHSHDRDQFSTYSKGSIASSGDDDVDSLQSHPFSSSERSAPRSVGTLSNHRAMGFSKKPTKILSSSAPKRSFDLALRQMERKGPQNMFRPLLSSVPSSTFYAGKASIPYRPLTSKNSSITTSSNASSDQGTSGVLDTEESEQNQEDVTSDFVKGQYPILHDEVFVMDQAEAADEAVENRIIEESPNDPSVVNSQLNVAENNSSQLGTVIALDSVDVVLDKRYEYSDTDGISYMEICSKCNRRFHPSELVMEEDHWLCRECKSPEVNSSVITPMETLMENTNTTGEAGEFIQVTDHGTLEISDQSAPIQESLQVTCTGKTETAHLDNIANKGPYSYTEPSKDLPRSPIEKRELAFATQREINQSMDGETGHQHLQQSNVSLSSSVDVSEGTGISLLLKRSSSNKGYLVQSRSFTASNISYDDLSYVRDSTNSMRSSMGHSSASVSSSVELGSSRQTEKARIHRQSSGRKSDIDNYRYETTPVKHKRSVSSLSGASGHASQVPNVTPSYLEDSFETIAASLDTEAVAKEALANSECTKSTCTDVESSVVCKTTTDLSSHVINVHVDDTSMSEEPASHENEDNLTNNRSNSMSQETSTACLDISTQVEDVAEVPHESSLHAISEIEIENNADNASADSLSDVDSTNSKSCMNELVEPSVASDDVMAAAVEEVDVSVPVNGVLEGSTIVLEDTSGAKPRSLTLEEATDAILFCSSIVHNLAYEAANIAIDKETPPVEPLRPTVTFVGKSNTDGRDIRSRTLGKRGSKSHKARQRKLEADTKPIPVTVESDDKSTPHIVRSPSKVDSMVPPKQESKCNCAIM